MKPFLRLANEIVARLARRREPSLYHRCLAVHLQAATARGALSS